MYECKVFSPSGELKRIYSPKEVQEHFDKQLESQGRNLGQCVSKTIFGTDYECVCTTCGKEFKGKMARSQDCNLVCEKKRRAEIQAQRYQDIKSGKIKVKAGKRAKNGPNNITRAIK